MPSPDNAPLADRDFGLPIRSSETRRELRINARGVRLEKDRVAWTIDGESSHVPFARISAVHLETNAVAGGSVATCKIEFESGASLTIFGSDALGAPDGEMASLYRAFVAEFHQRLAPVDRARIDFTCGYSQSRYFRFKIALYMTAAWVVALPFALLLITGEPKVLLLLLGGIALYWPMRRAAEANAPRAYRPDAIPGEMLV